MPEALYVSDDWLYPVLGGSGDCILALLPQSSVQDLVGAGAAGVRI